MIEHTSEIVVIGSGFAGSLMALVIDRIGLPVVLIDQATHPRFAIGESSTPIADMTVRRIAQRYDLPRLLPLACYGKWKQGYPNLACGLKRGFSYFQHVERERFRPQSNHTNELLVAASADDNAGDTHWYRADVDHFLVEEVRAAGIPYLDATSIVEVEPIDGNRWALHGKRDGERVRLQTEFLVDATGAGAFLPKQFCLADEYGTLQTRSRAIYGHFDGVPRWRDHLIRIGGAVGDHPYDCDASAVHHLLDGAWIWVLRFDNGRTSIGLTLDEERFPLDTSVSIETEWSNWMDRYPDFKSLVLESTPADRPGPLIRTGRLQRKSRSVAAENWVLLPHTAGFVDPLHSTGIALSLTGVDRLAAILEEHSRHGRLVRSTRFVTALKNYGKQLQCELGFIDELVAACYRALGRFPLFSTCSMLYFAAATDFEYRQSSCGTDDAASAFLGADRPELRAAVRHVTKRLASLLKQRNPTSRQIQEFEKFAATAIEPFNRVGLFNPQLKNMYHHTSASKS